MTKKESLKEYENYTIQLANVDLIIEFFKPGKMANSTIEYDDESIVVDKNTITQKTEEEKKKKFSFFHRNNNNNNNVVIASNVVMINGEVISGGDETKRDKEPVRISLNADNAYHFLIRNAIGSILIKDKRQRKTRDFKHPYFCRKYIR